MALEYLKESAFTKEELESYDRYWDSISSERSLINEAEAKGIAEGELKGELKEKELVILTAFETGLSLEVIARLVRLS